MSFQPFSVNKIGGEEMPQKLLYNVFKTLTDRSYKPTAGVLDEDETSSPAEDKSGKMFIDQWTPAVKDKRMITNDCLLYTSPSPRD